MVQKTPTTNFTIKGRGIVVGGTIDKAGFGKVTVAATAARRVEKLLASFPSPNGRGHDDRRFTYFFYEEPMPSNALDLIDRAVKGGR